MRIATQRIQTQCVRHRQNLRGKRLHDLDGTDLVQIDPASVEQLLNRGSRTDTGRARIDADGRPAQNSQARKALFCPQPLWNDGNRGGPITESAGVSRRNSSILREGSGHPSEDLRIKLSWTLINQLIADGNNFLCHDLSGRKSIFV